MDSLAPNSVCVVTCEQGDVEVTLNCKMEADLCLLLLPLARTFDVNELLSNNKEILRRVLT